MACGNRGMSRVCVLGGRHGNEESVAKGMELVCEDYKASLFITSLLSSLIIASCIIASFMPH